MYTNLFHRQFVILHARHLLHSCTKYSYVLKSPRIVASIYKTKQRKTQESIV
jgi:hypothetical protein